MNKNIDKMPPSELMEYLVSISDREFHQLFVERGLFHPLSEKELEQWIRELRFLRSQHI